MGMTVSNAAITRLTRQRSRLDRPATPSAAETANVSNDSGRTRAISLNGTSGCRRDVASVARRGAVPPAVEVRRLDAQLRQRQLDLRPVLHAVLGRVGQEEPLRVDERPAREGQRHLRIVVQPGGDLDELVGRPLGQLAEHVEARPRAGARELALVLPPHRPQHERLLAADHVEQQLADGPRRARDPRVQLLVAERTARVDEAQVGPSVVPEHFGQAIVHGHRLYRSGAAIQPAIWARELKPSLFRMLRTWLSTVRSEMNRRPPISLLLSPSATSRATSTSRGPRTSPPRSREAAAEAGAASPSASLAAASLLSRWPAPNSASNRAAPSAA